MKYKANKSVIILFSTIINKIPVRNYKIYIKNNLLKEMIHYQIKISGKCKMDSSFLLDVILKNNLFTNKQEFYELCKKLNTQIHKKKWKDDGFYTCALAVYGLSCDVFIPPLLMI